jgi:hypothetical protein
MNGHETSSENSSHTPDAQDASLSRLLADHAALHARALANGDTTGYAEAGWLRAGRMSVAIRSAQATLRDLHAVVGGERLASVLAQLDKALDGEG